MAFLAKVEIALDEGMQRKAFNTLAQAVYNSEIKEMARTYHDAYIFINNDDNRDKEYHSGYYREFNDFAASFF